MNEMVERVAEILFNEDRKNLIKNNLLYGTAHVTWEELKNPAIINANIIFSYRKAARKALEGLKPATDQQQIHYFQMAQKEGADAWGAVFQNGTWERMIDAALEEKDTEFAKG